MTSVTHDNPLFGGSDDDATGQDELRPVSRRWIVALRGFILVVALGGFGVMLWQVYAGHGDAPAVGPVPILRADVGETRRDVSVADDPNEGGMAVPYRDMLVMRRSAEAVQPLLERVVLMPAPERPLPVPGAVGSLAEPMPPPGAVEYLLERPAEPASPAVLDDAALDQLITAAAPQSGADADADSNADDPIGALLSETEVELVVEPALMAAPASADAEPEPGPAPVAAPLGTHGVQLGALRDAAAAEGEIRRLARRFPNLLGEAEIVALAPAATGGLTRLIAIGLDQAGAQRLCTALRERGGDCFVRDAP